ncbi:MAG: hypothetical protein KC912_21855 [Proteobacteria bacterium]|nr:hypothetical protein [Pseudomonadota bacterium]
MSVCVLGVAARTALGDLRATLEGLHAGETAFTAPPYEVEGLSNAACGVAIEDRHRPAEALLRQVVGEALAASTLPEGCRIGLVVGTSSGNIAGPWERWHAQAVEGVESSEQGTGRDGPTLRVAEELGLAPTATLSVACVSGTAAFAVADGWLRDGEADVVVVAGVDALCRYVHSGFSALGALSASQPRPFDGARDGLLLGEGAAAVVIARHGGDLWLTGTGIASDARHFTAPDREGRGAIAALGKAVGTQHIDWVSMHGTGTLFNDSAEVRALEAVFPSRDVAVHGVKHAIGHTMGAAGAIEAAVLVEAMRSGRALPAPVGGTPSAEDAGPGIGAFASDSEPRSGASISSAFGGLNAAICLAMKPLAGRSRRRAAVGNSLHVSVPSSPDWRSLWPDIPKRALRQDRYVRTVLFALSQLIEHVGPLHPECALILSTPTGCRIADLAHHERLLAEGAQRVSRRTFTYTVVHAPLAEATLHWDLRGPQLAFVGDVERGRSEARRWVELQGAPQAVAVHVDAPATGMPSRASVQLFSPEDS